MRTKAEETAHRASGCLARAAANEPLFILRAQDELAPTVVRIWVQLAKKAGAPAEKLRLALGLADRMEDWQETHPHKVSD